MKTYIYMNEQIRYKKPKRPVIVVKHGKKEVETNDVLLFNGFWDLPTKLEGAVSIDTAGKRISVRYDPKGLKAVKSHAVKAWIEIDD